MSDPGRLAESMVTVVHCSCEWLSISMEGGCTRSSSVRLSSSEPSSSTALCSWLRASFSCTPGRDGRPERCFAAARACWHGRLVVHVIVCRPQPTQPHVAVWQDETSKRACHDSSVSSASCEGDFVTPRRASAQAMAG